MDKQQLEAIRARDADYNDVFEAQASMSKDIAHRLVAWPVADRRALLAYVDELRSRLAEAERDAVRYRWLRDRAWPFEFNGDTPADADAAIDAAMRPPAKNHTPRCSYWDGLFAQVCNCGAADNERA